MTLCAKKCVQSEFPLQVGRVTHSAKSPLVSVIPQNMSTLSDTCVDVSQRLIPAPTSLNDCHRCSINAPLVNESHPLRPMHTHLKLPPRATNLNDNNRSDINASLFNKSNVGKKVKVDTRGCFYNPTSLKEQNQPVASPANYIFLDDVVNQNEANRKPIQVGNALKYGQLRDRDIPCSVTELTTHALHLPWWHHNVQVEPFQRGGLSTRG